MKAAPHPIPCISARIQPVDRARYHERVTSGPPPRLRRPTAQPPLTLRRSAEALDQAEGARKGEQGRSTRKARSGQGTRRSHHGAAPFLHRAFLRARSEVRLTALAIWRGAMGVYNSD